ncbi:uncharacterized protein B0H64DRAFT_440003 [Chaetomium fimeti]|uniref:Uncharacterized protein n=1 Tax=Chaetomium fimeti TaxID=1854472 RepID=A0AAE0LW05_9PEZI|nr:hypothetical protein B0H64DRAFT_440003 [Chaetomium fimeti]
MTGQGSFIPGFGRPVTVDYIDHHVQKQHPMFVNPPVQYDPMSGQYAPVTEQYAPMSGEYAPNNQALAPPPDGDDLPPRPDWTNINAMGFWNGIFPDAMTEFKKTKEPRGRSSTDYSIRCPESWDEIYHRLEAAQAKYQQVGGPVGWLRKMRRTVANNITPVAGAAGFGTKAAPCDPIATPVLAAVELVLDAVKTAACVRQQAVDAFDGLIPIFSDVELFLGTFRGDVRIRRAAVDLTVTTLDAIERAIGFFISNEFLRGGKALLNGGDYEKSMVESLDMIKVRSSSLMEEAAKSHIHEFHMYSRETQRFRRQLVQMVQNVGNGMNSLNNLLEDYVLRKDRELKAAQQENQRLHIINERLLAATPSQQGRWTLPPPQPHAPAIGPYICPEGLRRILDTPDLDLADLAFINDKKGQLLEGERTQAEQIINTQLFQRWIVSTSSAKLLVHWDLSPPETIADVSPLSVLCATMTQALRAKEGFVSALWFCGQHIDPAEAGGRVGGRAMLASLIDQLLRQHAFDTRYMYSDVDLAALQAGGLDALTQLLGWLVRQLPETATVFCIVDGVYLLERDELKHEALPVLLALIRLAEDSSVAATVKLLLTSTLGTDIVRGAFEEEDLILNVDGVPQLGWAPNDERMIRELEGEMDEAAWK